MGTLAFSRNWAAAEAQFSGRAVRPMLGLQVDQSA